MDGVLASLRGLTGKGKIMEGKALATKMTSDHHGRIWVKRKMPFVDRMASAWLIRRFIDKKAEFRFMDEKDMDRLKGDDVTFDVREGGFTHTGDMCTFEVIIKVFGLKEKALRKISEIVHEIDTKDGKYSVPGAGG